MARKPAAAAVMAACALVASTWTELNAKAQPSKDSAKCVPNALNGYYYKYIELLTTGRDASGRVVLSFEMQLVIPPGSVTTVTFSGPDNYRVVRLDSSVPQPILVHVKTGMTDDPPVGTAEMVSFSTSCDQRSFNLPVQVGGRGCPDYALYDNRGSGEDMDSLSPPGAAFMTRFLQLHRGANIEEYTNPYPAAGGDWNLFGAFVKVPHMGAYHDSVVEGKRWLTRATWIMGTECPSTRVIVTGYSQGAQVSADVFQDHGWQYIDALVLFGDPYFNGRDPVDRGNYSEKFNGGLSFLHAPRPLFTVKRHWVLSFCHRWDPVCQGPLAYLSRYGFTNHKNYDKFGEPELAAETFK
jgi:hypothetical protein